MKVSFRQSGGFAGLIRGCELDSAELPDKEAAELNQLLRQPPAEPRRSTAAARDLTHYELSVETPRGTRTQSWDDLSAPDAAALIEFLRRRSTPQPPS